MSDKVLFGFEGVVWELAAALLWILDMVLFNG